MSFYVNPFPQHFDANGNPLAFFNVFFGEPNQDPKLFPKAPFSDSGLSIPIATKQTLDDKGSYSSDIFLDGFYSIRIESATAVLFRISPSISGLNFGEFVTQDTVADAVANTGIAIGAYVTTLGYNTKGDGGGANYNVVAGGTGTADGGSYINLANGNQLELLINNVVNVKQFGSIPFPSSSNAAFLAANTRATTEELPITVPSGDYLVQSLALTTSILGDGIGRSNLIFDCSGGAVDGITFNWTTEEQTEYEARDLTIKCLDGNGGTAITNEKGAYFSRANKIIIKDVAIQDFDGPDENVVGFLTEFAWLGGVNIGDVQGARIDNLFVYANYKVNEIDVNSPVSTGLTLTGSETGLFIECNALWINACRTGFILGDNSFGFVNNSDVTFSLDGIIGTTNNNFNEVMFANVAVNAQRTGFDFNGIVRLFITDTFSNRHSSGIEQGNVWTGYKLEDVTKSFVNNAHAQPNITVASLQNGFDIITCGDTHMTNLTAANVDTNTIVNNSSNIHGNIIHADLTGTILNMINNARVLNFSIAAGESFTGDFFTDDGSLDIRNINVKVTNTLINSTAGPTRFVESITISDKDNIGVADEGFVILSDAGSMRLQALDTGVATNIMLIDMSGGVSSEIDFRTSRITNNDQASWTSGNGSPEGVITAVVGSFFSRLDGGAGSSFYVKEAGAGNTGWTAK